MEYGTDLRSTLHNSAVRLWRASPVPRSLRGRSEQITVCAPWRAKREPLASRRASKMRLCTWGLSGIDLFHIILLVSRPILFKKMFPTYPYWTTDSTELGRWWGKIGGWIEVPPSTEIKLPRPGDPFSCRFSDFMNRKYKMPSHCLSTDCQAILDTFIEGQSVSGAGRWERDWKRTLKEPGDRNCPHGQWVEESQPLQWRSRRLNLLCAGTKNHQR